uniref:Uncharacterized protein n=1 Tax=Klebsiella pneumoniae TaxID=573 RepID=A0A8D9IMG9_KLEPN|nr:hypothetical protein P54MCR8_PROKKA_00012 [Klebsiella pneumoniae]
MKQTPQQKAVASKMRRDHPDMSVRQIVAHLSINPEALRAGRIG